MTQSSQLGYKEFLASKHLRPVRAGFDVPLKDMNPSLFDWQKLIVQWALKCGRAALFESPGMGKTAQQLEWARHVVNKTKGKVLLLCPLVVGWQTVKEAEKFNIGCDVRQIASNDDVCGQGVFVCNYEKIHLLKPDRFDGVVCDESGILKSFVGKTKQTLCNAFKDHTYRLPCTATPAPNDRMELGNHSEFLGVMPSSEMLQRWFVNDGGKAGSYRLRRHGEQDFWRWMASWSVCISSPADLGFPDEGYVLPGLIVKEHVVESGAEEGFLFAVPKDVSATEVHQEKRANLDSRADLVASLVNKDKDCWIVWCDTNYEADALTSRIPDAVEVRGSHKDELKEERLRGFTEGKFRVLVTKASVAGWGLNFQMCHKTTWFASYSYEAWFQAIRRMFRFGQKHQVECHVVRTTNEGSIVDVVQRKQRNHEDMQREMALLMKEGMTEELGLGLRPVPYEATQGMRIPEWLVSKEGECL